MTPPVSKIIQEPIIEGDIIRIRGEFWATNSIGKYVNVKVLKHSLLPHHSVLAQRQNRNPKTTRLHNEFIPRRAIVEFIHKEPRNEYYHTYFFSDSKSVFHG